MGGDPSSQKISVAAVTSRRLEERISVRFPAVVALVNRTFLRLPPRNPLRRAFIRRTVQLGIEAANRRDVLAAFALYAPDVELTVPPDLASLGFETQIRGKEERIRFEVKWRADWGDFRYAPEWMCDLGDRVLVVGRMTGSGSTSGATFDNDWAYLATLSAGRVIRERVFFDPAEALRATGLSS